MGRHDELDLKYKNSVNINNVTRWKLLKLQLHAQHKEN